MFKGNRSSDIWIECERSSTWQPTQLLQTLKTSFNRRNPDREINSLLSWFCSVFLLQIFWQKAFKRVQLNLDLDGWERRAGAKNLYRSQQMQMQKLQLNKFSLHFRVVTLHVLFKKVGQNSPGPLGFLKWLFPEDLSFCSSLIK